MQIDRERLAQILSGAPFPSKRSLAKIDAVLAEIAAQGFVVTPREPTLDMCAAGMEPWGEKDDAHEAVTAIWDAMIDAGKGEG